MNNNNWISCETPNLTIQEKVLTTYMVEKINRSAKRLFEKACENQLLRDCFIYDDKDNRGVMTIIDSEDYYTVQISFEQDANCYNVIKLMHDKISKIIESKKDKKLHLSINAYNVTIRNYFKNYDFAQDYLGFEYSMKKTVQKIHELSNFKLDGNLAFRVYEDEHSQQYLDLLTDSFREQNMIYNKNLESDKDKLSWLKNADNKNEFGALWDNNRLIGLYVIDKKYIRYIAVFSEYEDKGYGTAILNYCHRDIFINKEYDSTYLYIYAVNAKAQKMYLKSGYEVNAYYSENTYRF